MFVLYFPSGAFVVDDKSRLSDEFHYEVALQMAVSPAVSLSCTFSSVTQMFYLVA